MMRGPFEKKVESFILGSRWLLTPFYLGLDGQAGCGQAGCRLEG